MGRFHIVKHIVRGFLYIAYSKSIISINTGSGELMQTKWWSELVDKEKMMSVTDSYSTNRNSTIPFFVVVSQQEA